MKRLRKNVKTIESDDEAEVKKLSQEDDAK